MTSDRWLVRKELKRFFGWHVQNVGDGLALEQDVEGVPVIAAALADLAWHIHVGQEVHLNLDRAITST